MKLTLAKIVLRVMGTLSGLLGVGMLFSTSLILKHALAEPTWLALLLLTILPFPLWMIFVGCLVWARLSPFVIRQVCGVLGFLCLMFLINHTVFKADIHSPWTTSAFVGLILVTWGVYRIVSKRLNHWLFPEFG